MKISKLFHWLYASVMFLPLLIIPLFGIWSINHDHNEPISVDVSQNLLVDFNQRIHNGNFVNGVYWNDNSSGFASSSVSDNVYTQTYSLTPTYNYNSGIIQYFSFSNAPQLITGHKYYLRCEFMSNQSGLEFKGMVTYYGDTKYTIASETTYQLYEYLYTANSANHNILILYVSNSTAIQPGTYIKYGNVNLFDFTQMYGAGNEPTIAQFNAHFSDDYYAYTDSEISYIKDVSTLTYSDTDIGSQFLYTLYNSTEKYLNFDDVLNLGAISDWINQNVFNGNAPLVFYIVWHYLDYWLILSIFWLCFDVLIYVPNIAHRWLDKASLE